MSTTEEDYCIIRGEEHCFATPLLYFREAPTVVYYYGNIKIVVIVTKYGKNFLLFHFFLSSPSNYLLHKANNLPTNVPLQTIPVIHPPNSHIPPTYTVAALGRVYQG